ncbi:hypothetical protein B0H16DRAFT_1884059 [Mycena metata]|uniref:Uncharacterized protein n=1 Tax=Mycena metata TaxID=1033252 RepID=A0AAD7JHE0_9AGAR|nr:hypothetical protein B0H16DRAFT_1884059 [Mycena metata]
MQCRFFVAFLVSYLALAVTAAPIAVNDAAVPTSENLLSRTPQPVDIARSPEPKPEPGCKMYGCIYTTLLHTLPGLVPRRSFVLLSIFYPSLLDSGSSVVSVVFCDPF